MGSIPQLKPAALISPFPYSSGSLALAVTRELHCQAGDSGKCWLVPICSHLHSPGVVLGDFC